MEISDETENLEAMGTGGSTPVFAKPNREMGGNPNISIFNNTQYVVQVEDDFFRTYLRLTPRECVNLGAHSDGLTLVRIQAYDHRDRLLKKIEYRTWTGFSWIVKEDGVKRQKYGSATLDEEDPEGPLVPWAMDLREYFRETDAEEERDFIRVVEDRRQEAVARGVDVTAATEKIEEGDEQEIGDLVCKVCWAKKSRVMFEPCGHLVTCPQCASQLSSCCICRRDIFKKHRVFF